MKISPLKIAIGMIMLVALFLVASWARDLRNVDNCNKFRISTSIFSSMTGSCTPDKQLFVGEVDDRYGISIAVTYLSEALEPYQGNLAAYINANFPQGGMISDHLACIEADAHVLLTEFQLYRATNTGLWQVTYTSGNKGISCDWVGDKDEKILLPGGTEMELLP